METVQGIYRNGQVILEREVNWPNGSPLEVRHGSLAHSASPAEREDRCFDGSLPPSNPEEVEEWLKWFDSIEPFDWTEDERRRFEQSLLRVQRVEVTQNDGRT